jgi:hypothetical protein
MLTLPATFERRYYLREEKIYISEPLKALSSDGFELDLEVIMSPLEKIQKNEQLHSAQGG